MRTNRILPSNLDEVIEYAKLIRVNPVRAAVFWEHGIATNWIDRNGDPIVNWKDAFKAWLLRLGPLPEHQDHEAEEKRLKPRLTEAEQRIRKRDDIIWQGRRAGADDETIGRVLSKHGLEW